MQVAKLPMILKPLFQEAKTFWWPFRFLTYAVLAVVFAGLYFLSAMVLAVFAYEGPEYRPTAATRGGCLPPYGDNDDDCDN
jgi:hypothetical protein